MYNVYNVFLYIPIDTYTSYAWQIWGMSNSPLVINSDLYSLLLPLDKINTIEVTNLMVYNENI